MVPESADAAINARSAISKRRRTSQRGVRTLADAAASRASDRQRADSLSALTIEYIDHPSFHHPEVAETLLAPFCLAAGEGEQPPAGLPAYLASLYEVPLLTKQVEEDLFSRLNCLKCQAAQLQQKLNRTRPSVALMDSIEDLLRRATDVRNHIVRANLRLVVAMAKKFADKGTSIEELLSEGHLPLIRAVELFDFSRGNRFSTYATWAVRNHFVRTLTLQKKQQTRFTTSETHVLEAARTDASTEDPEHRLARQRKLVSRFLVRLQPREQTIVASRFGLTDHSHPQTLSEIGRGLGISKERVRQLTIQALEKLKAFASEAAGETLPADSTLSPAC